MKNISATEWISIISVITLCIVTLLSHVKGLKGIGTAIDKVDTVVDSVHEALPQIPYLGIVSTILEFAKTAVKAAEQKANTGLLPKEERKQYAINSVLEMAQAEGITLTEEQTKIIDDAIESLFTKLDS